MNNSIQVYQNNTLNLFVQITETGGNTIDLSGYTAIMDINIGNSLISVTGDTVTSGDTVNFVVSSEQNYLIPYVYEYEVYVQKNTEKFTIIKDNYIVLSSLIISS